MTEFKKTLAYILVMQLLVAVAVIEQLTSPGDQD
jgi:hypothetical protein